MATISLSLKPTWNAKQSGKANLDDQYCKLSSNNSAALKFSNDVDNTFLMHYRRQYMRNTKTGVTITDMRRMEVFQII